MVIKRSIQIVIAVVAIMIGVMDAMAIEEERQMTTDIKAGIGLSYDYEDWDFTGATGFRDIPWGDIHRTGIDLSFQYAGIENWTGGFRTHLLHRQKLGDRRWFGLALFSISARRPRACP